MDNATGDRAMTSEAIVVDIDDTLIDLGDRRLALFRKHFPHAAIPDDEIRRDIELAQVGDRQSVAAKAFLADFSDPAVVAGLPIRAIQGATNAICALEAGGLTVVLVTGRMHALRERTLADLARWQVSIAAVTPSQVHAAAQAVLRVEQSVTGVLRPVAAGNATGSAPRHRKKP